MKRIIAIMLIIMVTLAMGTGTADAKKKHHKKHKYSQTMVVKSNIHCPYCGDGTETNCPYYCGGEHMTDEEIAEFLWLESHYQDDEGNWITR